MASLTAVFSWEVFKNETCFLSLDQYAHTLKNQFSIPVNFLDLDTTSDGVPIDCLPDDCLRTVFSVLSKLSDTLEWNPGFTSTLNFLCLLARRRDNRPKLLLYDYLVIVDNCLRHVLEQAGQGTEHRCEWINAFDLGSKFIEWLFDSELTWRKWIKVLHSGQLPPEPTLPKKGNGYASNWLINLVIVDLPKLPLDHLKRVLSLMCSEVATTTTAAWTTINQEVLTSLVTAAIAADDDVERSTAIIESLTFLLQRLAVMDENHRRVDSAEAVKSFCSIFASRKFLQQSDILCIAVLLQTSVSFKMVIATHLSKFLPLFQRIFTENRLMNLIPAIMGVLALATARGQIEFNIPSVDDSIEVLHRIGFSNDGGFCRDEAISCGLYSHFLTVLKERLLRTDTSLKDIREILTFVSSWADGSAIISWLSNVKLGSKKLPKGSTLHTIVDGNAFSLYASLACEVALSGKPQVTDEAFVCLQFTQTVLSQDNSCGLKSLNEACNSCFIRDVVTSYLLRAFIRWNELETHSEVPEKEHSKKTVMQLVDHLLLLLKIIGIHSIPLEDAAAILSLLKKDCIRNRTVVLLEALTSIIRSSKSPILGQPNGIFSWFEFEGPTDSLLIIPSVQTNSLSSLKSLSEFVLKTPDSSAAQEQASANCDSGSFHSNASGLTFFFWIYLHSSSPNTASSPQRSCLLRMLSAAGNGLEIFFSSKGELVVATAQSGEFYYSSVCGPSLIAHNKWTALSFVFSNSKGFFAKPTLIVYVDVTRVFEQEFPYPLIKEDLILFHYGGCPLWVEESCYSGLALKLPVKGLSTKSAQTKSSALWSSLGIVGHGGTTKKLVGPQQIGIGEERPLWGPLKAFRGRLSYTAVFSESASEAFIQWLVQGGENSCTLVTDLILQSPQHRVLFYYHAKAFNDGTTSCLDLALSGVGQSKQLNGEDNTYETYNLPGYLHGAVRLSSTTLADSIYRLGGIQFLLPLFELLGNRPSRADTTTDILLFSDDLSAAMKGFREILNKVKSSKTSISEAADFSAMKSPLAPPNPIQKSGTITDERLTHSVLNAAIEILQVATVLLTTSTPFSSLDLAATCSSASPISALFNFLKALLEADTRMRHSFLHPSVVISLGHLLNSIDPLQLNVEAVNNFHDMLNMCATSILTDLDIRVEASGDLVSANEQAEERRMARETLRVRWNFLIKQIFVDWSLWSRCSPVATLHHVQHLLKKAKALRNIYRSHFPMWRLLTAAGFYFAPKKTVNETFQSIFPLVSAETRNSLESDLLESINTLMKYIRQGLYSIIRVLYTKNTIQSDLRSLFAFLESSAHPDVISEVIVLISHILNNTPPGDPLLLFVYEQHMVEKIYSVLLAPNEKMHAAAKENALKLLYKLATTEKVPNKSKTNIFFGNSGGFRGFLAQTEFIRQLTFRPDSCRFLRELIKQTFRRDCAGLLQYLSLMSMGPLRERIEAVSLLFDLLDEKSSSVKEVNSSPAFYDSFVDLLLKSNKIAIGNLSPESNGLGDICEVEGDGLAPRAVREWKTRRRSSLRICPQSRSRKVLSTSSFSVSLSEEIPTSPNCEVPLVPSFGTKFSFASDQSSFYTLPFEDDEAVREKLEETLGELVVKALHRLLWPGSMLILTNAPNMDQINETLSNYHEVFVSLSDTSTLYTLVKPFFWIMQRLLEEFLASLNNCLQTTGAVPRNTRSFSGLLPFMQMIVYETCNHAVFSDFELRTELLDQVCEVAFDRLRIWDAGGDCEELAALVLHFLLTWASRGSFLHNGAAAQACARLHDAICASTANIALDRVIFLLFRVDDMIQVAFNARLEAINDSNLKATAPTPSSLASDDVDNMLAAGSEKDDVPESYFFYAPLIKALLDKYHDRLEIGRLAPHLPNQSPNFITEFGEYCLKYSDEWNASFLQYFQCEMETYTRKYIVHPSTEQSLMRALANESVIKARRERSQQVMLATQRLAEYHPNLVSFHQLTDRDMSDIHTNSTSTDSQSTAKSSGMQRNPTSTSDFRRGSFTSRSISSSVPSPSSPDDLLCQLNQRRKCLGTPTPEPFDYQMMERETRVVASMRRKRWLNLRFEFVRASPFALWFSPFPQEIRWRLSELETGLRVRSMMEPNPWFSSHHLASEERNGIVRKISCLEDSGNILQKLSTASGDQNLCLILQQAGAVLSGEKIGTTNYSLFGDDFRKVPFERSVSVTLGQVLPALAFDQEEILRQKVHKRSLVEYSDMKGDFIADEDWKIIHQRNPDKSNHNNEPSKNSEDRAQVERETDEFLTNSGASSRNSVGTSGELAEDEEKDKMDGGVKKNEEEELATPTPLFFEEPEPLKCEVMRAPCQLISPIRIVSGWFAITPTSLHFLQNHTEPVLFELDGVGDAKLLANESTKDFSLVLNMNDIREVHLCRYNLRRSAIEIFLIDNRNCLFNFLLNHRNKVYACIMSHNMPQLIYHKGRSPAEVFKFSRLMERWANREISNFEYLMRLNTIAGRTYNDLSQYPVFPWILADYTSNQLNFDEPGTFRDLSRPIGIANPNNIVHVREKYETFEDPSGEISKFHYGTHYSSAAGVMHYLVRTEPFASLHIQLQGQRFDVADRQFNSIPTAWSLIMSSPYDNRELIPEFFYFPDFLRNDNGFDLGRPQMSGKKVDDVELPPWAPTPEEFIRIHRGALESDYVSANLHKWIDLIFGYKQRGKAAENALNVYYYLTYEGAVDLDDVTNPISRASFEGMIKHFGQTPCQLLKVPHLPRISYPEWVYRMLIQRHLPVLNAAIIYMKTNMEYASREVSWESHPDINPERKLSVRLARQRTRSTLVNDEEPPIELSQHTIEIYFSYHPAPKEGKHKYLPAFSAVVPCQVVQLPHLCITAPADASAALDQKRASLHDELLLDHSTRSRIVSGFKSMLPSASVATALAVSGNSISNAVSTTSKHLVYQIVTVDAAGWVRHHLLTPLAQNEPGAVSESELLRQMQSFNKISFRTDDQKGVVLPSVKSPTTEPEPISPAHIDQERLRTSSTNMRHRFLGPMLYPPREIASEAPESKSGLPSPHLYALSTNGCHLYAAGRWDNRIAVYSTRNSRLDTLVTTPHTDVITALAIDPGCYRKSSQRGSAAQYLITGSRDGTVCVWNFTVFLGRMAKQVRTDRSLIENFEATKKLETENAKNGAYSKGSVSDRNNGNCVSASDVTTESSDGYPADMQEEVEACIQPGMPFDDSTLNFGCGCKVTDGGGASGRRTSMTSSNFISVPTTEVAKVIRLFPADASGRPISNVALYLALDVALSVHRGSNVIRLHAVKRGVWSRQIRLPESATVDHLLVHSVSVSFLVQWNAKESREQQLRLTRFSMNGRCVAETPVFQEGHLSSPTPANTQVTRMLITSVSPSANAKTVVNHILLLATSSGHLIMREAESLAHLRIFSIGAPIVHMSITSAVYGGGTNILLLLADGAIIVAYPGLTAPLTTLTSVATAKEAEVLARHT